MRHIGTILTTLLGLYALVTGLFLISENRRPQSALAWMLAFLFAPGIGVLVYFCSVETARPSAGNAIS